MRCDILSVEDNNVPKLLIFLSKINLARVEQPDYLQLGGKLLLFFVEERNRCVPHRTVPASVNKCPFQARGHTQTNQDKLHKHSCPQR